MAFGMQDYEREIAACKKFLFAELFQSDIHNLLDVGMGTGPNLKYYKDQRVSNSPAISSFCMNLMLACKPGHYCMLP